MAFLDQIGGRAVAKEVVNRRSHFECSLIAMAPHCFDPAGIKHPTANHLYKIFLQGSDSRAFRRTGVSVIGSRSLSTKVPHNGVQSALKLKVVVRIEDIMFPVILILMNDFD